MTLGISDVDVTPSSSDFISVSFHGRAVKSTGLATSVETESEYYAALRSILLSQEVVTMNVDTHGSSFVGLDLKGEGLKGKSGVIPIGETHQVHLCTAELDRGRPKHQLAILIFDVEQQNYIDKHWTINLWGSDAILKVQVDTVRTWASDFDSSVKSMSAALNELSLVTANGGTLERILALG
jgi:hypothetical protein